jgi:peroxiredoxin
MKGTSMQHTYKLIRYFLAGVMLFALGSSAACGAGGASTVQTGTRAPDFTLEAVRGGSYHLQDLRGKAVLLSFINSQAEASATPEPSRSQIVFLKSMMEQYEPKGMVVLIVDAARIRIGKQPTKDDLINFTYDWQLDNIPVLIDKEGSTAHLYGVSDTPTTFLIGPDGNIQQRWDGFASASQLALALEALVGPPVQRQTDSGQTTPTSQAAACPNETPNQARFSGVGLARPLSDELWVVDGGQPWGTGAAFPLQWILLDNQNITQQTPLHIQVIGQYTDNPQVILLVDQSMELLSPDMASGLLSGDAAPPTVYSLVTTVFLERPGCLEVRAVVTREGTTARTYQGSLVISAR